MRRGTGIVWAAGLVALGLTVRAAGQAPGGGPRLELSSREWDFGRVWQGEPLRTEITVRSAGDAPLTIEVSSSCGCTVVEKPRSPLPPGATDVLTITYDSAHKLGKANQTVTLTTNERLQPKVAIAVRGEVLPLYEVKPSGGIVFGQLLESSAETRAVEIINRYTEPLDLRLKEGQDFGPYRVELRVLEPGQRYELSAATQPPLAVGSVRAAITLLTGLPRLPEIGVVAYGFVRAPVEVQPKAPLLLPRNSIMDIRKVLRVVYSPDQPIRITGLRSSHAAVRVELAEPPAAPAGQPGSPGEYQIIVTLPPGDRIPEGAEPFIEIQTDSRHPDYRRIVVPIRIIAPRSAGPPAAGPQHEPDAPPSEPDDAGRPGATE